MPHPTRDASSGGVAITAAAAAHTGHDHRKESRSQCRTGREDGRPERRRGKSKSRRSSKNSGPGRNRPKVEQERKRRERKRASVVFPTYSHVFKGPAPTSTVVQAASFASTAEWEHMPRAERESRDASRRAKRDLLSRVLESFGERQKPRDDIEYGKPVLFKVRGGALLPLEPADLARCTVLDVDLLRIKHPSSPDKGLVCNSSKSDCPVFVLAPRDPALETLGVGDADFNARIVSALEDVTRVQKSGTIRSCEIVCEGRYTGSFGVVVPRGEAGTRQFSYHKDKLGDEVYDLVVTYVRRLEDVFVSYIPEEVLWYMEAAKRVSNYKTMQSSNCDAAKSARIFSSLAVAKNATLASHKDIDFVYSLVTVLLKNYDPEKDRDRVVAYFVFPDANVSVPLRHGDVLIFNPRCQHSVSSRASEDDTLLCLSLYTKTSHIGGNDNGQVISDDVVNLSNKRRAYLEKS